MRADPLPWWTSVHSLATILSPGGLCAITLLVLLLAAPPFRALLLRPQEPLYHGRPWSAWLAQFDHYPIGLSVRESQHHATDAVQAVLQAGTNSLPTLLAMLSDKESKLNLGLLQLVSQQTLITCSFTPAHLVQRRAAAAFEVLGTRGQAAVPQLINLLNDRETAALSAVALAATGSQAVQPLPLRSLTQTHKSAPERHTP